MVLVGACDRELKIYNSTTVYLWYQLLYYTTCTVTVIDCILTVCTDSANRGDRRQEFPGDVYGPDDANARSGNCTWRLDQRRWRQGNKFKHFMVSSTRVIFFFGHMSFFGGHWYPCFGFLVTSPLGFKARVGSALFAEVNVMYIPEIHLWCYTCQPLGGWHAAGRFPTCMCRGGTLLRFERVEDERPTIVSAPVIFVQYQCHVTTACSCMWYERLNTEVWIL